MEHNTLGIEEGIFDVDGGRYPHGEGDCVGGPADTV